MLKSTPIKPLSSKQGKLLRLIFDAQVADGEALNALAALRLSFVKEERSSHDLVDALESAGLAAVSMKDGPDYGACKIPFGSDKGKLFREVGPDQLYSLRRWCHQKFGPDGGRFAILVGNIEKYLNL